MTQKTADKSGFSKRYQTITFMVICPLAEMNQTSKSRAIFSEIFLKSNAYQQSYRKVLDLSDILENGNP